MKRKIFKSVFAMCILTTMLVTVALAAVMRTPVSCCPRCGTYGGTSVYVNDEYHNTSCAGCGTAYQQYHYDFNNDHRCDGCKCRC